ncbi:related to pyridoxine 4-dehydrogenase [Cephalotrichum gorgonifer]|uniref:Related to pyridoxine 4-dehydrogenase n=1 Tax=Cephalotrichum gorgonifer TaxID=2041049 RepID=A0AAE8MVT5_9PEZI|nr:related to pyridoxine 4-dehydrogenase [Cephalotrichum gorgonifer]
MSSPTKPKLRQLGKGGPNVNTIGFGLMGLGIEGYGPRGTDEERFAVLDRAWEIGCTNWDTSNIYGDSEDVIGKWFKLHPERRADIFLASKFGMKPSAEAFGGFAFDSSPEYCRKCIDESLKKLGVDYIDLYYVHRVDSNVPIEKTIREMKALVDEGKIKYIGLSEISSSSVRRAHSVHPISAVQVEYNPWTLDIEGPSGTNLLDTCNELGIAIFVYSPLGRGIMTGAYRSAADFGHGDFRAMLARYQGDNFNKNLVLVDAFTELAQRKGCTPGQLVLAWILEQSPNMFVIPGTKKIKYLEENFGASSVEIAPDEEKALRKLVSDAGVGGGRDPIFGHYMDTAPLEG